MKVRLIVTYKCSRDCPGCCNKNWKYDPPVELGVLYSDELDEFIITGGEPMLFPVQLRELLKSYQPFRIRGIKIYLYTAYIPYAIPFIENILPLIDGLHYTIHDNEESANLKVFQEKICLTVPSIWRDKTFRLDIFPKVTYINLMPHMWQRIQFKSWIKDCPLPKDEKLYKLKNLWQ